MDTKLVWKEGMTFEANSRGLSVTMDARAPLGHDKGPTPKEIVLMGLAGCTAMDVIGLLKKHKQHVESLIIETNAEQTEGSYPQVFTHADLIFRLSGDISPDIAIESIELSQTKYCGVSAMLSNSFPITWKLFINDEEKGTGKASFKP